ncbi:PrsW family glutamic-type intramembrane protease [Leptospira sp. GIMC2001]|uniref:PrsW family glutamic-type intramembrane protease n=1 Tax=Leptospira sp. GIMC2001 TaxID=1513297 RepID=UPI00234A0021|nr:PrsW family glutamic-type intramembrane protease [Leptospira sp. GIMC2001]WCL48608.1 PrsW family glutamic-type intramembrane protease [Leptospira sp. GIMC2001]
MKFEDLTITALVWGFFSILPWAYVLIATYPKSFGNSLSIDQNTTKQISFLRVLMVSALCFLAGILSTYLILEVNPIIWPQVEIKAKKPKSLLTQTIHLAFIQAGMVEEAFKISFILLIGFFLLRNPDKTWNKGIVPAAGFTALGFAFIENSYYIFSEVPEKRFETYIGRTIHSSNIHMLINLCFALFLLKSNSIPSISSRRGLVGFAFFLAVMQHGVVDFFLIPASNLGAWIATAMFIGIWVWVVRDYRVYVLDKKLNPI